MDINLNGKLVPEEQAVVSVLDRGFLYGDGLFETLRVRRGRLFRWNDHTLRLRRGSEFLRLAIPFTDAELEEQAAQLIDRNGVAEGLLRLTVSRGIGPRGYSPRGAEKSTVVMTTHPLAAGGGTVWRLAVASLRLPANEGLARFKTCNKLPQILARLEAEERGADEALLLNTDGFVVEGASSNLFWVRKGAVETPKLESGILAGVTRMAVLEICRELGMATREASVTPAQLQEADGVWVSLSSLGVVEAGELDGVGLGRSVWTGRIQAAYEQKLNQECGG